MAGRTLLYQETRLAASIKVWKKAHVELGYWVTRTRIIALTKIGASIGIPPPFGDTRVASQLGHCATAGGELEEHAFFRGIVQVTVLTRGATVGI